MHLMIGEYIYIYIHTELVSRNLYTYKYIM